MTLREKLLASFHAVGTGTLRLDPESAAAFASHVANANEGIYVVGQLCVGPNALKSETLALMLERWFRLLPEYSSPKRVLESKAGPAQIAPELSAASSLLLHARVLEVCVSQRNLSESQALAVATHVREAAAGFFALEQKCRAPDRHTQRALCATLRAALGRPLEHARGAATVFIGTSEA
jgi:hypothetical protein